MLPRELYLKVLLGKDSIAQECKVTTKTCMYVLYAFKIYTELKCMDGGNEGDSDYPRH